MAALYAFLVGASIFLLLIAITALAWVFWRDVAESEHDVRNTVITTTLILALMYVLGKIATSL